MDLSIEITTKQCKLHVKQRLLFSAFFDKVIINPYLQIKIGASHRLTKLKELTRGKTRV